MDVEAIYKNKRGDSKEQLHLVVVGHVDAGKSTLLGRLLWDLGQVPQRLVHKYQQESKKIGKQSFAYAWVLDETGEERWLCDACYTSHCRRIYSYNAFLTENEE